MLKKIFNADDFGISRGVNAAIEKAYRDGILNSASLMVNQKYAQEAVLMAQKMPHLEMGLHLNLTNETPAADPKMIPMLVNKNGKLKNGFMALLLLSIIFPRKFSRQVEIEIRAQVRKYLQMELLGHNFFAFVNIDTDRTNVLYLRKDGDLGLLEPEA